MGKRWWRAAVATTVIVTVTTAAGTAALASENGDRPSSATTSEPERSSPEAGPDARGAGGAAAADVPQAAVGITKESSLDGGPVTPGAELTYTLTVRCSGLTVDCVNQTVSDVLPANLDVVSLPSSTDTRQVSYDAATRTLTVRFLEPLQEPVGELGLPGGATRAFDLGMRLPADSTLANGASISNTGTTVADNAPEASSTNILPVSVPRDVRPVATKTWADGSAVAGSAEGTVVTLGVRNASSSSVSVHELRVDDVTPATYENFDVTGAELVSFPAGADRARLLVCTAVASSCGDAGAWTAGPVVSTTGTLALPGSVAAGTVTGIRVVFTDSAGDPLPYDATGGTVRLSLQLRDTVRSTGAELEPATKVTVSNCAVPGAIDETDTLSSGPAVCDTFDVLPDTVVVTAAKSYVADTNGNFTRDSGEYAVVGENSPVSASISVRNSSAFPLRTIRISEPDPGAAGNEFAKLDVTKVRLRFPQGATEARLVVTYEDGSADLVQEPTATTTVDVARAGTRVSGVEVVYTGVVDGQPSIAQDATAYLDLHGLLNDAVTSTDLPNGSSPGVVNCAAYRAQADTSDSTGTASGNACASLAVETRRYGGSGVKSVGQTEVPPGQPIPFTMTLTNNGNVPLVDAVLYDPPVDADGTPRAADNPFVVLELVSASVRKDSGTPGVEIEVYDSDAAAWVAYAADPALLARSTGIKALVDGELTTGKRVHLDLVTQRRAGVPDGVSFRNCFATGAVGWSGDPACAAEVTTAPSASGATINKSITPGQLAAPIPGVPEQTAQVRVTIANTANMSARRLQVTDADADFFDAVDFGGIRSVTFPVGANRVQVDALTAAGWQAGTPVASSGSYGLPAGIVAADVVGVRVTFTAAGGGYGLTPCEGTPTPASCTGVVVFDVHPRATLRADPGTATPVAIDNSASGGFETRLQTSDTLAPVDPVAATLGLVEGDAQLDVQKTPNSAISPGEVAPFRLTVTNSGTANLPQLVVRDSLPVGLTFDEAFQGGTSYRVVDVQVPTGYEAPPAPTFATTSDAGRVSGLRWSFGDWVMRPGSTLTIEIQVRLAPGVTEGQVNTNLMGATSTADDLACAPGTGNDPDDVFGDGTWCTDTAAVTTKAGAAFEARKWVAGDVSLGWWDNRNGVPVDVGDNACPSVTEDGRTYTAYPCVALVNPGDRYHYLLRMVNAGTEPATRMRVIDRFPVRGDKGVVLDGTDRGTEWNHRPLLATAPVLIGPGVLSTTYANSETGVCTDDLDMTDACGDGTWSDGFGPEAVATQMRVQWDTPLAPGDGVSIAFAMDTPLDVTRVADPTIAWNSFGHAETTVRANGSTRVLPPTEPIQVGVATAYGTLRVVKQLLDDPGGLPVADRQFDIDYRCRIEPQGNPAQLVAEGTLSLRPGESAEVPGLPGGALCEVWEDDAHGGVTNHPADDPALVTIDPQLGDDPAPAVTVVVTNSYPLAALRIIKALDGEAASYGASTTYPVEVLCAMDGVTATGFPVTVDLIGATSNDIEAPAGATCTATELDDGGATTSSMTPSGGVLIVGDAPVVAELTVTNTFEAGHLQILKRVVGAGTSLPEGPFEFEVACTFQDTAIDPVTVVVSRPAGETEMVTDVPLLLPVGALCTITETDTGGADATPDTVTVTIVENADDNTVQAVFTNLFSAGTVALTKELTGAGADDDYAISAAFTVDVTCTLDTPSNVLYSAPVEIRGGERVQLADAAGNPVLLPLGAHCWADETGTGGATSHTVNAGSYDDALVVASGTPDDLQQLELRAVNTFDLSSLVLDKVADGAAASYAVDREFTIAVSCVLPQDGARTPLLTDVPFTVTAGEPVVIDRLPVGAECWARETDSGGATHSVVQHAGPADPALVTASPNHLEVTNTFAAGELAVAKLVVDGPAGPYRFAVACTTDQGEVALRPADAEFSLRDGEQRTIVVPLGAACQVREKDVPKDAEVTLDEEHSGAGDHHDGDVVASNDTRVTVINTFDTDPQILPEEVGPNDPDHSVLPNLGGPSRLLILIALLLLVGGAALVRIGRRRT